MKYIIILLLLPLGLVGQTICNTPEKDNNPNQLQHEIISRHFIEPIRDALKEWDGASQTDQYYEDMAWGALEHTTSFNVLYPPGSTDRDRILAVNHAEDTNSVSTNGSHTAIPKGNPC